MSQLSVMMTAETTIRKSQGNITAIMKVTAIVMVCVVGMAWGLPQGQFDFQERSLTGNIGASFGAGGAGGALAGGAAGAGGALGGGGGVGGAGGAGGAGAGG